MASEASLKAAGRKWLKEQPYCRVTSIGASLYGENGISDTHVNWRGFNIWIEFKAPDRTVDPFVPKDAREHLQKGFIESQIAAGGYGFFCSDLAEMKKKIAEIDGEINALLYGLPTIKEWLESGEL